MSASCLASAQRRAGVLGAHLCRGRLAGARAMSTGGVKVEAEGAVVCVTLDRPSKFNALNLDMVRDIAPHYDGLVEKSPAEQCVLMTGEGGKAFCAGGDVAAIRDNTLNGGRLGADFFFEEYTLNHRIATAFDKCGLVQVAVWDGVTMGGGVGLSLHGKVRIATEKTLFAMPETALGLFPDVGGTFALSRLAAGKNVGVYMALTGCRLGPADCLWSGLATHYVPRGNLGELRSKLAALGDVEYDTIDGLIRELGAGAAPPTDGKAKPSLEPAQEGINKCFGFDTVEEIMEALKAYASDTITSAEQQAWAEKTLETLGKCCPASLKITLRAVLEHASPSVTIGSALRTEYRVAQRMLDPNGDFFEGVRAVLVDKDGLPRWHHASVPEVPASFVDSFFAPLPEAHVRGELNLDSS